jgi:DNA-binding beta-propeller fold protein YncE
MTRCFALAATAILGLLGVALAATAQASGLRVIDKIAGPDGGWDYASFDPARGRVYVAHGSSVLMIDAASGKVTPSFAAGNHLHAVVPVPGSDRIVTTNSGDMTAKIIDADTGALIASIPTPEDPDSAIFDPHTGDVVVIGGEGGTVSLIDPKTAKAVGEIDVGGDLEFAVPDGRGRLFVNAADKNEIVVVDLDGKKVVTRFPMAGCLRPTGLAYVEGHRLISACQSVAEIIDADTGHEIATLPIGVGPDAVIHDSVRHVAYIPSGRAGTLAVIALAGPGNNTVIDTIATKVGARTGTVDTTTGRLYLPSADYLPAVAGQRPAMKPGTFQVLVLGPVVI